MEVEEAERVVVIAKPIASRPACSTFRPLSVAGAINASSSAVQSSQTPDSAIRPKTVRFKPSLYHPLPPAGFDSSQWAKSDKIYKPMAKLASKTTVSLLANMRNCSTSYHQPPLQEKFRSYSHPNSNGPQAAEPCKVVPQNMIEEDTKALTFHNHGARPSYDGYNWRKYGQKQVKGSEYPRSYYKCTNPNCPAKKKVERSLDGQITEIVYNGEHNHSKPQPLKRNPALGSELVGDGMSQDSNTYNNLGSSDNGERKEDKAPLVDGGEGRSKEFEVEEDELSSKRRKNENQSYGTVVSEDSEEPVRVVPSSADSEIVGDGFRWKKYGQKVVKGNPYPRSYYRCTNMKCKVRKHVERAIDEPRSFITKYEGKHNHEMPLRIIRNDNVNDQDSQAELASLQ
ncbi:WRKY transcription factor 44-like [Prosopis cineraria]|uniref:WRKY transcription factor 44-like n=1 Tax=Prosopis cineraria TaxID=364024 RepID=UPI002410660A|nr:WRKY transcription factor 44-like [Prosopis cineraria]